LPVRYLPFPDGYTTEVSFKAFDWLDHMARVLKRGFLITIDYGYNETEYYAPHRTDGTLTCYHRHTTNNEPLDRVGEQDITAHVNFTWLISWGEQIGLHQRQFTDQTHFLMDVGKDEIERIISANPGKPDRLRQQLQTLLHPGGMGRAFKVLIQQKS
jgi:SAM-dependent MidA family methyltransferase